MSRNEFIKILKEEISQYLDRDVVNEQLDYYDNFITNEIDNGKKEKEVIDELGDPRLIAKTIRTVYHGDNVINDGISNENHTENHNESNKSSKRKNIFVYDQTGVGCLIFFLVFFIIIAAFFRFLLYGSAYLFFSPFVFLLPLMFLFFNRRK